MAPRPFPPNPRQDEGRVSSWQARSEGEAIVQRDCSDLTSGRRRPGGSPSDASRFRVGARRKLGPSQSPAGADRVSALTRFSTLTPAAARAHWTEPRRISFPRGILKLRLYSPKKVWCEEAPTSSGSEFPELKVQGCPWLPQQGPQPLRPSRNLWDHDH